MGIVWKLLGAAIALVAALVAYVIYLGWDVQRWDARIDALCAANGGRDVATRVYETAVAPETPEYFVQSGPRKLFKIVERLDGETLPSKYPYVVETRVVEVLRSKQPNVTKFVQRIVRVSDNKVLGERYGYQRAGGGISWPDPETSYTCPSRTNEIPIDAAVFSNHPMHGHEVSK